MSTKWIFIIDTDSYAGNFEREMCAYLTGVVGECGVGEEMANLYDKEVNTDGLESVFIDYLDFRPDDHGCARPAFLWTTKGWLYDGGDGAIREEDWNQEEANKKYRKYTAKYYQEQYERTKKLTPDGKSLTAETIERELKQLQKEIDRCLSDKTTCFRQPPNNSVAIFFDKKPTEEMIALMKNRAAKFAEAKRANKRFSWDNKFKLKIHGFRLVEETTKSKEEEV